MRFDRRRFFDKYNQKFGGLKQFQVEGLERLLWGFETYYGWWDLLEQIANALSQVKHETNSSFNPVVEGYYLAKNVPVDLRYFQGDYQVVKNFQERLRYYPHFGMGDIQLTWEENYVEHDALVRRYFPEIVEEYNRTHTIKFNLKEHPEQALDGKISFCIFTIGMHKGTFRAGHTLDRHITPTRVDHFNARDIVNGDKRYKVKGQNYTVGEKIAADARKFEEILRYALVDEDLTPDNISQKIDSISVSTVASGGASQNALSSPTPSTVEIPPSVPGAPTDAPAENSNPQPAGNLPTDPPKVWFNVEDWKPRIARWLKATWGSITGLNFTQGTANFMAAVKDYENWWIYVCVFVVVLIITLIIGAIVTGVSLFIWYFNRKEIVHYKTEQIRTLLNPNLPNFGLNFEKK